MQNRPDRYYQQPQHSSPFQYPRNNFSSDEADYNNQDQHNFGRSALLKDQLNSRNGFVRKVYSLLSFQLGITFLMCLLAYYSPGIRDLLFDKHTYQLKALFWVALVLAIVIEIAVLCRKSLGRKVPTNYIMLFLFTVSFGITPTTLCALCYTAFENGAQLVIMASLLTALVTITLTIHAITTDEDYTGCGGLGWGICTVMSSLLLFYFIFQVTWWALLVIGFSVIAYSIYLVVDVQLIAGGRQHELLIDDYVLAAMLIYVDIIILFMRILEVLAFVFGKT